MADTQHIFAKKTEDMTRKQKQEVYTPSFRRNNMSG